MIRLRPHHLLCMLTYVGRGYSPAFTANMNAVMTRLARGETIRIVSGPDDICAPVQNSAETHCYNPSVTDRDRMAAATISTSLGLSLQEGTEFCLSADMLSELRAFNAADAFASACLGCPWQKFCNQITQKHYPGVRLRLS